MKTHFKILFLFGTLLVLMPSCYKVEKPGGKQPLSVRTNSSWESRKSNSVSIKSKTSHSIFVKECNGCKKEK